MSRKLFHTFFILILIAGLVITEKTPAVRAAGPWYVSPSGDDSNDCLNPTSPCATINGAIGKASSGDSIFVSIGTYTGTGDQVVLIDKSLTLSGGWDLAFTTQDNLSILDGQSVQRGVTINSDVEAIIENVQVQNGFNNIVGGGGIYNSGSLTLNNSHVADNTATSSATGGGILNLGSMTISDSTVRRNDGNSGGGITNMGTMTLNNSILENNDALTGGGVASFNIITLNSSIIINNTAQTGGGVHASGAISVRSSIIKENTARGIGGGINADGGASIIIENSIVSDNVASSASGFGYGGGIHNYGNTLTITNSTIARNLSINGGGIFNGNSGISNLNSSTISGNTAEFGGGILSDSGAVTMRNLILAGNTATLSSPDCSGGAFASLVSAGNNLIGNTANCNFPAASTDLVDVDPKLSLLMGPSGTPNYYPLITGSPAIDAGNPAGCTDQDANLLTTDQRGVARDSTCDIGAYEFTAPGPAVSLLAAGGDNQITGTSSDFPNPLQAAALDSQGSPVSNVTVDYTAPSSGPSGTFADPGTNTSSAVTDEGGVAVASVFTANDQAGAYTVTAAAAGLGSVEFHLEQVDRPANDNFGDAVSILSFPFSAATDISNAGIEPGEPHVCFTTESTIWYSFAPTETTSVHLDTQGSAISTNITIYRAQGPDITDLQFLKCANSSDSFLAEANQTYYLQVRPGFGESGLVQVNLATLPTITGRVTDAGTSAPLPGNAPPFASVILRRVCGEGCLEFVSSQTADGEGRFLFDNYFGSPLPTGSYQIEVAANSYQTKQFAPFEFDGVNLDLGDLPIDPLPAIGSIRGRLLDAATGGPVSELFIPSIQLYRCTDGDCSEFLNSQVPDGQGRFRFETDSGGNPLTVGTYRVVASADQYQEASTEPFDVGAGMHQNVGNLRITSFPVRFSHVQPCSDLPASGGECSYSVRIWNGLPTRLIGDAWSVVNGTLPDSFAVVTDFEIKELQSLNLEKGRSKVFHFRFNVPGTGSSSEAYICARLFVGQGLNFRFNTIGFRELLCILRNAQGLTVASPQAAMAPGQESVIAASTGTEIEPNSSCQTAQNVGAVPFPYVLDGNLDSSAEPDIDFYRFSGTPGTLISLDHEGQATGKGTLGDPYLGVFDSNCNLMDLNDDFNSLNSHLKIAIPSDGVFIVGATVCCDSSFVGGGNGSYQLTVAPIQTIGSITGRVTNSLTGSPLRGDAEPFAFVRLLYCDAFGCADENTQLTDGEGRFLFTSDANGVPLRAGNYQIVVSANQYMAAQTELFTVGEAENYDLGDFALTPFPVLFSEIQPCSIPSEGGFCNYSVKITNGLATQLSGKAWSVASGTGIGSFAGFTVFQTDLGRELRLDPGQSTTLRFRFRVPGSVADGATICALAYVGQNPSPFFHPVGLELVFCLTKGTDGFTLLSAPESQAASLQIHEVDLSDPFASKK